MGGSGRNAVAVLVITTPAFTVAGKTAGSVAAGVDVDFTAAQLGEGCREPGGCTTRALAPSHGNVNLSPKLPPRRVIPAISSHIIL